MKDRVHYKQKVDGWMEQLTSAHGVMPISSASATASRFAAHWVADALAADDALDISAVMSLLDISRESLTGSPEVVSERVALRCLQELAAATAEDGAASAPPPAGMLRVDVSRSCEDLLLHIIAEVRSQGSLEKDMLPAFSQDIQNIICIKKPALPETCFKLLRELDPEIACIAPTSPVEQNGNNKHDDQSLCKISHDHAITHEHMFPTDDANFQQKTNLVNEADTGNIQKDSVGVVGVSARSLENGSTNVEGNMLVPVVPASATCNAALKGSTTELLSKQDIVVHTAVVQQSCMGKSPNQPHHSDVERPPDDGTRNQSSKDPRHGGPSMQAVVAPAFDKSSDALPINASETSQLPEFITAHNTTIIPQVDSSKTHMSSLQHDSGEKVNQDLDYDSTSSQPVEKDFSHEELTLRGDSGLPSVSCNGSVQGGKSDTNNLLEKTTEHTVLFEQQNGGNSVKVNQALFCDNGILEKIMAVDGLNVQSALAPRSCNFALHNKISDANYLSNQNIRKNTTDVQKRDCSIPVQIFPQDGDGERAIQRLNKKTFWYTLVETPHIHSLDDSLSCYADKMRNNQDTNGSPEGSPEQDLCIKCGKDGKLLKCSSCLLAAHESCFVSLVTFEDSGQFCCPVCFYTKATEAYQKAKRTFCEARKNLAAFLGTEQNVKQRNEQLPGVLPIASHDEDHLNWYDSLTRKSGCQTEANSLAHRDEVPDRQRKKQKTNATSDACPVEAVTEKVSSVWNSVVEAMNKHFVLQNNNKQVQRTEKEERVENTEAHEEAGNGSSYNKIRNSSHNKCNPSESQEVEADKKDDLTNSNQSEDSNDTKATSSNYFGKRSLPPLHNIRHRKAKLQQRETPVSSYSRKVFVQQDQHMPSPLNYAYPTNLHSNPVDPIGRRSKVCWMEEEEAALREAMAKFTPQDDGPIPWSQILQYGKDVFHRARLPCDLRIKWRNMKKKEGS